MIKNNVGTSESVLIVIWSTLYAKSVSLSSCKRRNHNRGYPEGSKLKLRVSLPEMDAYKIQSPE